MITDHMLVVLGIFSMVTFVGSLMVVPWLIRRLQPDFFLTHWQKVDARHRRHPLLALVILLARNGLGLLLLLAGIAMLVLPGQGLLTMLMGLCFMDFPGKRRILDGLVQRSSIQRTLNWIRRKQHRPEFVFPGQSASSQ